MQIMHLLGHVSEESTLHVGHALYNTVVPKKLFFDIFFLQGA